MGRRRTARHSFQQKFYLLLDFQLILSHHRKLTFWEQYSPPPELCMVKEKLALEVFPFLSAATTMSNKLRVHRIH